MTKHVLPNLIRCTNSLMELWAIFAVVIFVFGWLFSVVEGVNIGDSLYWACVTATSTGFGDIAPKTAIGKAIAVALMFIALFAVLPLMIGRVIAIMMPNPHEFTDAEQKRLIANSERTRQLAEENYHRKWGYLPPEPSQEPEA